MAYPQHWLLAFGGHSGHVDEIWNCGIRLAPYGEGTVANVDEEQYLDDTAIPALTAWLGRTATRVANVVKLNWVKFNEINGEGLYNDAGITHERQGLNIASAGSTPTVLHPLQVCCVLSWRTDAAVRGLASKGRIYSPRPDFAVDGSGDVSGPIRVEIAGSAATLLNSLDASIGIPPGPVLRPSILSRGKKTGSTWGEGAVNQIDSVVVDSSLDIQRRRSNHQSKETTTAPVVYS